MIEKTEYLQQHLGKNKNLTNPKMRTLKSNIKQERRKQIVNRGCFNVKQMYELKVPASVSALNAQ